MEGRDTMMCCGYFMGNGSRTLFVITMLSVCGSELWGALSISHNASLFLPSGSDSAAQMTRLAPAADASLWDVANISLLDRQLVLLGRDEEVGPPVCREGWHFLGPLEEIRSL